VGLDIGDEVGEGCGDVRHGARIVCRLRNGHPKICAARPGPSDGFVK
jgi:hypothetical protein